MQAKRKRGDYKNKFAKVAKTLTRAEIMKTHIIYINTHKYSNVMPLCRKDESVFCTGSEGPQSVRARTETGFLCSSCLSAPFSVIFQMRNNLHNSLLLTLKCVTFLSSWHRSVNTIPPKQPQFKESSQSSPQESEQQREGPTVCCYLSCNSDQELRFPRRSLRSCSLVFFSWLWRLLLPFLEGFHGKGVGFVLCFPQHLLLGGK